MRIKDKRGFTLIELMMAMGISVLFILILYNFFVSFNQNYSTQEEITEMQQLARASIEFITREMRNIHTITSISCTADNSSLTFSSIEEVGTATNGSSNTLTDSSKSWDTNGWQNHTITIIDGTGGEQETGASTGSNTSTTVKDTAKSWSVNEWQNYSVTLTSGTGAGQTRNISSNTATQLTMSVNWTTIPDSTSAYRIWQSRTISSNTATQLTVSSNWAKDPNSTSLYQIRTTKGFSRDAVHDELDYTKGGGTSPFAQNIEGFTLQGYDSGGSSTCNAADIETLEITLTARTSKTDPKQGNQYHYFTVKDSVMLRN